MSGKYGTLGSTEQSGSHFQDLNVRHRGESSVEMTPRNCNEDFVSVEVSSSHLTLAAQAPKQRIECKSKRSDRLLYVHVASHLNQ